jgi:two-component system, LytTR family, sensor kinase
VHGVALTPAAAVPVREPLAQAPGLRQGELLLIFGFWTFIALLTLANSLLDLPTRTLQPVFPASHAVLAFGQAWLWALLTPPLFLLSGRWTLERANWPHRLVLYFVVGVLVSIVADVLVNLLRFRLFHMPLHSDIPTVARLTRLWFMNEFVVYLGIVAAGIARHYYLRDRARREETIHLQAQAAHLQAQLAGARLAALRNQLDPHFLFNTLHAVAALVERDPRGVRRMIARLSELLRTTLDGAEEQEVPLERELAVLARYLEIMQIRFQGRLQVHQDVARSAAGALVPNLILQPLVENAIRHGVERIDGAGRIEIRVQREAEALVLSVRDNGPGWQGTGAPEAEGVGLRNTRARLAQLYGNEQSLVLSSAPDGGAMAEVRLPFHTRADLHTAAVAVEG